MYHTNKVPSSKINMHNVEMLLSCIRNFPSVLAGANAKDIFDHHPTNQLDHYILCSTHKYKCENGNILIIH